MDVLRRRFVSPSVFARHRRTIFASSLRRDEEHPHKQEQDSEEAQKQEPDSEDSRVAGGSDVTSYRSWLRTLADKQWKRPNGPRNWLAQDTPYPANPSFRPPRPTPDETRTAMYDLFMKDPIANNLRRLSAQFNVSLKRVEAILRLKGLEAHWKEGKTLQTGFLYGMEQLLDVKREAPAVVSRDDDPESDANFQMNEADAEDQESGNERDLARQRYQRFFFESVVDGTEPTMPAVLQKAKDGVIAAAIKSRAEKSAPDVMPAYPGYLNNPPRVHLVKREGRPAVKFIDVGGQFLDIDDRRERMKEAERRRRNKDKRQARPKRQK